MIEKKIWICKKCGGTERYKNSRCIQCAQKYANQYHKANKKKQTEYKIDNKEKIKKRRQQYAIDNKEKIKERKLKWQKNNKEKIKKGRLEYYKNNKDKIKEYGRRYRLKKGIKPRIKGEPQSQVEALRQFVGWSQQKLASYLYIRQQTISDWEVGNHAPNPSMSKLLQLTAKEVGFSYDPTLSWGKRDRIHIIKDGRFKIKWETKNEEGYAKTIYTNKKVIQRIVDNMNEYGMVIYSVVELY